MAMPSSSPPNPLSSTAATTTTNPLLFSNPPLPSVNKTPIHHHSVAPTYQSHRQQPHLNYQNIAPRVPQLSKPHDQPPPAPGAQGILYPLASSGRGFLRKPTTAVDQPVAMAGPGGFPPRPYAPNSARVPYGCQPVQLIRPTHLQHGLVGSTGGVVKGIPVSSHPKAAASPSSVADSNGYKDARDRTRDDSLATVRDRKVRIIDGSSLYAQCRSWLRNGFPEESQPQYVDGVKSLPRPLLMAIPVADAHSPDKKEDDNEEDEDDVDHLSTEELLQRHIKHAKKVRARLREERLQRIARYKTRLALLLPPIVEQQLRNDTTAAGN